MTWLLTEIDKKTRIAFDLDLDLKVLLQAREKDILDLSPVRVVGAVSLVDGFYTLDYQMTYELTMASTRSLEPVVMSMQTPVSELFAKHQDQVTDNQLEEGLVLILEGDHIVLEESVMDNILLSLPQVVLSEAEKTSQDLPQGQDWQVLSEAQYQEAKTKEKQAQNPFAALNNLFD